MTGGPFWARTTASLTTRRGSEESWDVRQKEEKDDRREEERLRGKKKEVGRRNRVKNDVYEGFSFRRSGYKERSSVPPTTSFAPSTASFARRNALM